MPDDDNWDFRYCDACRGACYGRTREFSHHQLYFIACIGERSINYIADKKRFFFFFVPAKWNFWVISNAYTRRRSLKKHKSGAIDQQTVWLCENVTRTSTAFRLDQTSLMLRDCYLVTHWWDSMKCVSVSTCWSFLALCDNLRVISVPV